MLVNSLLQFWEVKKLSFSFYWEMRKLRCTGQEACLTLVTLVSDGLDLSSSSLTPELVFQNGFPVVFLGH